MRLLVIGHTYMTALGQAKFRALRDMDRDVDILIVCPRRWPDPLFELEATPVREERLEVRPLPTYASGHGSRYMYRWWMFGATVARFRPDVVHIDHEPHALATLQALLVRRLVTARAAVTLFTWDNVAVLPPGLRPRLQRTLRRWAFRGIDMVMAGNHGALRLTRERGFAAPTVLIPQIGVSATRHASGDGRGLRRLLGIEGGFVIGFVGRVVREKGLLTLATALAQLTGDWTLVVVGDGELRSDLEARFARDGLARRVRWVGTVAHDTVPRLMDCMDALVLPSECTPTWQEQFGHVLIEAMASGTPVVGTASGEIPHVIGDAGMVVPEGDASALARALTRLMTDGVLREWLRRRGRARVERHYSHGAIARELRTVYRALKVEGDAENGMCGTACSPAE